MIFNCHNPNDNTIQPQHNISTVVGLEMKMTVQTPPPPTDHPQPTTESQWWPPGDSGQHSLATIKFTTITTKSTITTVTSRSAKGSRQKKPGKISDKCQITSYPLPPQPNNDNINSDKKLEV